MADLAEKVAGLGLVDPEVKVVGQADLVDPVVKVADLDQAEKDVDLAAADLAEKVADLVLVDLVVKVVGRVGPVVKVVDPGEKVVDLAVVRG